MNARFVTLAGMVLVAALSRLMPHWPNFTPLAAVALFGAANFQRKWVGFAVPLAAMLLSDIALEFTTRLGLHGDWLADGSGFYPGMWIVYGTFLLIGVMGLLLRRYRSVPAIAGTTLAASVVFFLVTNFAWWSVYDMYPHTLEGLMTSYERGLEFFRWTVLGDATYATALFGGLILVEKLYPSLQLRPA